jgi:transposase-like protein
MTLGPYHGDCCPACGSYQVTPYAVTLGAAEEYGYQCAACQGMWPVLTAPSAARAACPSGSTR